MILLKLFIVNFILSLSLFYAILKIDNKFINFFFEKKKSEHNLHKKVIINNAGIIIVLILLFNLIYLQLININYWANLMPRPYILLISIAFFLIISFLDSKKELHPTIRFFFQITVVYISLSTINFPIKNLDFLPLKLQYLSVIFFWVYIINVTNFIDGIDGMSGVSLLGFTIPIVIVYLINQNFQSPTLIISLLLLPSIITFLMFNFPPAKFFLGDTGSIPIGYLLGYSMINLFINNYFFIFFTIFLYPILDVTFNLIRKTCRGDKPWARLFDYYFLIPVIKGGKKHFYVLKYIILITLVTIIFNLISAIYIINNIYLFIIIFIIQIYTIVHFNTFRKDKK